MQASTEAAEQLWTGMITFLNHLEPANPDQRTGRDEWAMPAGEAGTTGN